MTLKQHLFTTARARAFLIAGLVLSLYYPWMDKPFNSIALGVAILNLSLAVLIWVKLGLANSNLLKDR